MLLNYYPGINCKEQGIFLQELDGIK